MTQPSTDLVVTGVATAEVMERIRQARDETATSTAANAVMHIPFDTKIASLVEVIGTGIFLNQALATPEEKLNYACSTAALVISYTAELMKQMVEASGGRS